MTVKCRRLSGARKPVTRGTTMARLLTGKDDGLTAAVNTFCDSANQRLGELSKKLFADYDEAEKRSSVYKAVGKVSGIDLNDQILLSDRLVENPKKMDLFFWPIRGCKSAHGSADEGW
ncbi:hypothetical protein Salat_0733000 [Sesamum alatum]|uniref:Uncharacterized protein n=1 Tax=Sesamum alatum TaxID=300844 RepID=A0AAE2CV68_9LAMI|nr:hypothetical protein Salat_0733000 [Sesamum alatum]